MEKAILEDIFLILWAMPHETLAFKQLDLVNPSAIWCYKEEALTSFFSIANSTGNFHKAETPMKRKAFHSLTIKLQKRIIK